MRRPPDDECTLFQQSVLDAAHPGRDSSEPPSGAHPGACERCTEFHRDLLAIRSSLDAYRVREPSAQILQTVRAQALRFPRAAAAPQTVHAWPRLLRILAAGLAALPVVLLVNAAVGWALYEIAVLFLPPSAAWYCLALFVMWVSLGVSLSYASLPFLSLIPGGTPRGDRIPPGPGTAG